MNTLPRAKEPFRFYSRLHLRELTGLRARSIRELLEHLREVPGSVVYHHTHHFLQQHQYLAPEPPNDFAYWVTEVLQEKKLGERLASINTCDFGTIRALRKKIISTIESSLEKTKGELKQVGEGEEFHFIKSISFVFPTPYEAHDLREFISILKKITVDSIYYHMFEARIRLEKGTNDFSVWFENSLGEKELAKQMARLDPYTHTMEGLREKIIRLVESRLMKENTAKEESL